MGDYRIIRSRRRTLALEITPQGEVLVRAPARISDREIARFIEQHRQWLEKHLEKIRQQNASRPPIQPLTMEEVRDLADRALEYIPKRVAYYAPLVGVTYGKITIRNQKTKWGSCSSKGNLNFNCLLMLAPPEVIDSIVVHELCHRLEMNHSPAFYAHVYRVFPDYDRWNRWLKENGSAIMRRMTG